MFTFWSESVKWIFIVWTIEQTLVYNDKLNFCLELIRIRCRLIRSFVGVSEERQQRARVRQRHCRQCSINWAVKSSKSLIRSWKIHSFYSAWEKEKNNAPKMSPWESFFSRSFAGKWLLDSEPNPLSIKWICIIFYAGAHSIPFRSLDFFQWFLSLSLSFHYLLRFH